MWHFHWKEHPVLVCNSNAKPILYMSTCSSLRPQEPCAGHRPYPRYAGDCQEEGGGDNHACHWKWICHLSSNPQLQQDSDWSVFPPPAWSFCYVQVNAWKLPAWHALFGVARHWKSGSSLQQQNSYKGAPTRMYSQPFREHWMDYGETHGSVPQQS